MAIRRSHYEMIKALRHGVRQGLLRLQGVGMLWMLVILGCAGLAQAQPQAPIEWGEARWLGIGNTANSPAPAVLMGDTLIFFGAVRIQQSPAWYRPGVIYSHDNGYTFGPWHFLDTTRYNSPDFWNPLIGFNGRAFALANRRLERSDNAGITWTLNRSRPQGEQFTFGTMDESQVITLDWTRFQDSASTYTAAISDDGGDHWRTRIHVPHDPQSLSIGGVATTQNRILVAGRSSVLPYPLMVATSDRSGENWSPFTAPPATPRGSASFPNMVGDADSETAIVLQTVGRSSWWVADIYINRTTDGGLTWEFERNLSEGHRLLSIAEPWPFCRGRLWGVVWEDYWNSDTTQWGVYWRLSANHGKDWYPAQPLGMDIPHMTYSGGQFVGNEVRLYWIEERNDFGTISGILTPDTIAPAIAIVSSLPDTIRVSDTLNVAVFVSENDTLSGVRLQLHGDSGEHWTVPMTRQDNGEYDATWIVPREDRYHYWFEAEDFWENVGYLPESEEFQFVTEGWSGAETIGLQPSSFTFEAFPNPFNARTEIRFALPQTAQATLTIYDLAGREVAMLADETFTAGEHSVAWNAAGLPSGVYFARLHAGKFTATRKLLLLR